MTYTIANNTVTAVIKGKVSIIHATNQLFDQLVHALRTGAEDVAEALVNKAARLKKHCSGKFEVDDEGTIYEQGTPMPESLSTDIIKFADAGADVSPLLALWNNVKKNPSESAKKSLYDFLKVNHVPITEDGLFLGYRHVREDWTDHRTGKYDNSIGSFVSMPRDEVDPDPTHTCSTGLHVAAFNYASTFGSQGHLIEVLVDPADVVTVPPDYNQQKMRVCAYTVLRECAGEERKDLTVTEEAGKNYRTYYLKNYRRPCKSMTFDDITSHKPAKAGTYACVRAATRDEAYQKFLDKVR